MPVHGAYHRAAWRLRAALPKVEELPGPILGQVAVLRFNDCRCLAILRLPGFELQPEPACSAASAPVRFNVMFAFPIFGSCQRRCCDRVRYMPRKSYLSRRANIDCVCLRGLMPLARACIATAPCHRPLPLFWSTAQSRLPPPQQPPPLPPLQVATGIRDHARPQCRRNAGTR
jgi:hypothetical protein